MIINVSFESWGIEKQRIINWTNIDYNVIRGLLGAITQIHTRQRLTTWPTQKINFYGVLLNYIFVNEDTFLIKNNSFLFLKSTLINCFINKKSFQFL